MKKFPMICLLIVPYIFLFNTVMMWIMDIGDHETIGKMYGMICLAVYLPNMIYAFFLPKFQFTQKEILFWGMLIKLVHIPIYIFIFMTGIFLTVFLPLGITLVPFLVIFDYLLLLSSGMYVISGIRKTWKEGKITKKKEILMIICQFIFCFDVISAVYMYMNTDKEVN